MITNGGIAMYNFEDYKNELLQDPELRKEWDALDPEFNEIRRIMKAKELTQNKPTDNKHLLTIPEDHPSELNTLNLF